MSVIQAGVPWLARMGPEERPKPIQWIPYDIPLARRDSNGRRAFARMILPMDLTEAEAARLSVIIGVLAFRDLT